MRTVGWGREGLRHTLTTEPLSVPAWGGGATGPIRDPGAAAREGDREADRVRGGGPSKGLPRLAWAPRRWGRQAGVGAAGGLSPTYGGVAGKTLQSLTHTTSPPIAHLRFDAPCEHTPSPPHPDTEHLPPPRATSPCPAIPASSSGQSYLPRDSRCPWDSLGAPSCRPQWSPPTTVPSSLGTSGPVPALAVLSGSAAHTCAQVFV